MLLSLSKGSPCPPSRSPPPRWGSGESARYVTRCSGDGGCTLETLKLAKSSKKVPRSRRKRRQRHKTFLFCCVSKGPNKRGIVGPFPKQQNGGFAALAHAPNLLPSNEQLIYLLLYSAQADCQATCAIAVSLTGENSVYPEGNRNRTAIPAWAYFATWKKECLRAVKMQRPSPLKIRIRD